MEVKNLKGVQVGPVTYNADTNDRERLDTNYIMFIGDMP